VDVALVEQRDVLGRAVVALEDLDVILLDTDGLLDDALVGTCDPLGEEPVPLRVAERDAVQSFNLGAEVGDELLLACDRQVLVCLTLQKLDELLLKVGLRLVGRSGRSVGDELSNDGALRTDRDRVVLACWSLTHAASSLKAKSWSR
jgi:hypothetical protein